MVAIDKLFFTHRKQSIPRELVLYVTCEVKITVNLIRLLCVDWLIYSLVSCARQFWGKLESERFILVV